ncbi:CRISPR-associated protein Cas4 [Thermaerobacter composti]|uniref:CRISPR-associated exonuclease Cas4 n=1 Tax=Thermaerobacter composti TaxID=554949 RepID=A0ABZ0QLC8_9FIRM|nr:CRISPR-associated protein Cas4 [Thermaerobacter composti]WPD18301.1 CRISPR-associated protein Cas4 [Thermaerobacter composti]
MPPTEQGATMNPRDGTDYLPISMLNQWAYCPRRFYYMYVLGEMEHNAPVLEGMLQHERVHAGGVESEGEARVHRRVYVWSDRLRIAGFADLVEVRGGVLLPVEYKHGRMGRWLNDHIQLCAQAMCLEERTGRPVPRGAVFYWGSRRRQVVELDAKLRARTEAAIVQARALAESGALPPPLTHRAKCRDCSLEPVCLPREVRRLREEAAGHGGAGGSCEPWRRST